MRIPGVKMREREPRLTLKNGTVVKFWSLGDEPVSSVTFAFDNPDALPEITLPDEIDSVTIDNRGKGEVVLKKQGGRWVVTKPFQGPASEGNVKSLLDNLQGLGLQSEMKLTPFEHTEKQLDAGHLLRVVVSGGGETLDVGFGKATSSLTPAILGGGSRVFGISRFSAYLYEREPESWLKSPPAREP